MSVRRLRVRLIGEGTALDPYRVSLPTYVLVEADYCWKRAIVDVPDDDLTPAIVAAQPLQHVGSLSAARRFEPTDDHYADWHEHLDRRYAEHAGRFRPRIV